MQPKKPIDSVRICLTEILHCGDLPGRLINHSRKNSNCQPKVFVVRDQPRLILVALRDIEIDEELFYDYGERRKDIVEVFPWLSE